MRVEDLLRAKGSDVVSVAPGDSVGSALSKFRKHRIGALVVSDDREHLAGMLTERDVVLGLLTKRRGLWDTKVSEIMSSNVTTCSPDDTIASVMHTMTGRRQRHLPVLKSERLAGVVSIGDVVKARLDEAELENRVLRDLYNSRQ